MAEAIIELVDLTKKYGSFTAVDQLTLSIRRGEIFGLLGPNGAGKSTTILMMLGLTEPTSGTARVVGIDPSFQPLEVKRKVGYLPEDVGFYNHSTGFENLMFTARLNSMPGFEARQKVTELLELVGLRDEAAKKTGKYSRGMLQRLGLADVLIKNPEIIILDEPTLGLDPSGVKEFLELIVNLSKAQGITVIFSSHDLHHVQKVCDRVGLFVKGKLLAEGDIPTLSKKLFSKSPFAIEVGLDWKDVGLSGIPNERYSVKWLQELLKRTDGILGIELIESRYHISSSKDITSPIAKILVESGEDLNHLTKKEYGLDDIYYRYFEGGDGNE